jgi:ABC-2 type transport system permease protein
MFERIHVLIIKELLAVWRDPKGRFLLIAPPLIQLLLFSFAATQEVKNVGLAIWDEDHTVVTSEIISKLEGADTFTRIIHVTHQSEMTAAIDSQKALVAVHFGQNFSRDLEQNGSVKLQLILDGRKSNAAQIVQSYIGVMIKDFNENWAISHGQPGPPSQLVVRYWFNPNLIQFWSIVPALSGILTMAAGLMVTALSVARERELGTFEQLLVTPLRPWEILVGKTVPGLLVGLGQGTLIFIAAIFAFSVPLAGSLLLLYLSLFVFLLSVIGAGLFISALVETQQQAMLGTFLFMVPAIILSGFATPVENMPHWLEIGTYLNPMRYYMVIVRGIFLKDMPVDIVLQNLMPMTVLGLLTLSASVWFFRHRLY